MSYVFGKEIRRHKFLLRDNAVVTNHGSYGTVCRPAYESQRALQEEMESHPDAWFRVTNTLYWRKSLQHVADFVNSRLENIVFVENATSGMNCVLRSVDFKPGDVILIHPSTYAAVANACRYVSDRNGAIIEYVDVKYPILSREALVDIYRRALDAQPAARMVVLDHISSQTALLFPVREIVQLCRSRGVLVAIDGAHAPGQVPLRLDDLDADFYTGNLHKWVYAPRGCALLWVNPKHHAIMRGPITSHFYKDPNFQYDFYLQGTRDDTAYHASVAAINFYQEVGGYDAISTYISQLLRRAVDHLIQVWGTRAAPVCSECCAPYMQLVAAPETRAYGKSSGGASGIMKDLYEQDDVQAWATFKDGRIWFRVSANIYNDFADYVRLGEAVLARSELEPSQVDLTDPSFDFPKNTMKLFPSRESP